MTVDKFGRQTHHHDEEADQIYLVKEVDLKTSIEEEFSQLKCAGVIYFTLQPGKFLQFNKLDYL